MLLLLLSWPLPNKALSFVALQTGSKPMCRINDLAKRGRSYATTTIQQRYTARALVGCLWPRCATHHPYNLDIVGLGPPGAAAHKGAPCAHLSSRAVSVGARARRPFCSAHRAVPRTTRHAAPRRCATLRHARCRCRSRVCTPTVGSTVGTTHCGHNCGHSCGRNRGHNCGHNPLL